VSYDIGKTPQASITLDDPDQDLEPSHQLDFQIIAALDS